jgi:hypothetical protein
VRSALCQNRTKCTLQQKVGRMLALAYVRSTPETFGGALDMSIECQDRTQALAAKKSYSIISSATESNVGGIDRLSALAAFRLMTNSNLVDCMTGRSAGFSPLRTRPA